MARITVKVLGHGHSGDWYYVSVQGRLSRSDLKRLERACGKALEHRTPPLEIWLGGGVEVDESVRFFLRRLCARGATVVGGGI